MKPMTSFAAPETLRLEAEINACIAAGDRAGEKLAARKLVALLRSQNAELAAHTDAQINRTQSIATRRARGEDAWGITLRGLDGKVKFKSPVDTSPVNASPAPGPKTEGK